MSFPCFPCNGTGRRHESMLGDVGKCMECDGSGRSERNMVRCSRCGGEGWANVVTAVIRCPGCSGKGCVEASR